jgi:predicted nucleic acid-binding protein
LRWLVDTNLFLRLADSSDPNHAVARAALRKLRASGETRCFATQNLIEFWAVATRPVASRGGLGLSVAEADRFIRLFRRAFTLIPETASVLEEWYHLVTTYSVSGVQAHDARLAALMKVHGITHILTFNTTDFSRYGITAVNPAAV